MSEGQKLKSKPVTEICKHLRPISLTPALSKVAEEFVVSKHIGPAILCQIDPNQFGVIPKSSTSMAAIRGGWKAISELSRELSSLDQSDRSIFSLCSQINSTKKIYIRREINKEKILILNLSERFNVWWYTTKDLVMCAKMSEVNAIFNVILMFQVSRRPATC